MLRLFLALMCAFLSGHLLAEQPSLWQKGVALTAEQILTHDYQEVVIEQTVTVDTSFDDVWYVLSDLQQYPTFYSLFSEVDVHRQYYRDNTHISEFTASRQQQAGRFIIEDRFYGIVEADGDRHSLVVKLWQLDESYVKARIELNKTGPYTTELVITTHLYAEKSALSRVTRRELNRPLFQAAAFKYLLEEGVALPDCMVSPSNNTFCL